MHFSRSYELLVRMDSRLKVFFRFPYITNGVRYAILDCFQINTHESFKSHFIIINRHVLYKVKYYILQCHFISLVS